MTVKVIDKGWQRIVESMKQMDRSHVKVGVLSTAGNYAGGTTLAQVAARNEYGDPTNTFEGRPAPIPSRPFLKIAFNDNLKELNRFIEKLKSNIFIGVDDTRGALEKLGELHIGHVKDVFGDKSRLQENAPLTIELKTKAGKVGDAPLIDDGRLRGSIDREVVIK